MAIELGTGYVSVTVQAKGIGKELGRQITGPLENAADEAGSSGASKFSNSFEAEGGSKLSGVATKLGGLIAAGIATAGAAAGVALAKGVSDAYAAEQANDKLAASLGLPPDRAEELGRVAGAVYRDAYGESLGEVNDVIARLFKDGLVPEDATDEALQRMTARVLDVSTAFDQDLGAVTRGVSNLLRNGLAPDAEAAFDIVTRGFQQGADKSEDFLDTLNEYGTQFRKLGIDGTAATGLIVQGLQAGARDGDKVADALKEFSIRAVDGSKLTAESFQALGLSAEDLTAKISRGGPEAAGALDDVLDGLRGVEDPAKRAQIAVGLFGTQSEDLGDALFALDLDTAAQRMGNVEGAAQRMGDTLNDNAAVKIEAFKRKALGGLADFAARYVIPALERLGTFAQQQLLPALQRVGDWVQANIVPALRSFGEIVATQVVPALAQAAQWIGDNVVPKVQALAGWLVENLTPAVQALRDRVEAMLPQLQAIGERIASDVLPPLGELWQRFKDDILPILKAVAEFVLAKLVPAYIEFQQKIDSVVLPVLEKLISFIGTVISSQVQIYDALKGIGKGVVEFVGDAKTKFDELVGFVQGLPGRISSATSGMWDGIKSAFRSAINAVIDLWNGLNFPGISVAGVQVAPGFGTPNIPHLASGGLITQPTVALLGETARARPEIASPEWLMRDVVRSELAASGGGATFNNTFNGTNVSAKDVAAELAWQTRLVGV